MSTQYYKLSVKEVIQETADAITIVFENPSDGPLTYQAGQFLTLIIPIDGTEVRRAYSLSSSSFTDTFPAVTVKRVENGLMSNYLNNEIKAGDILTVMEPMGSFTTTYVKENKRHLIMFGGGSGITPLISITKSILHIEDDSIVSLIYCNRDIDSIIFKKKLETLQTDYQGRLRVIHILDNAPMNWQGPSGLLNLDMLKKLSERIPDWGIENTTYLMCGPEGMMKNVETMLSEINIPKERIFKESFVTGIIGKDDKKQEAGTEVAQKVKIIYEGDEFEFLVTPESTILETALDLDIDLPYSCQSGLCTACRGKCISGKVKMDEEEGLSEQELEEGYVLTCVGHPLTSDVVIEIG